MKFVSFYRSALLLCMGFLFATPLSAQELRLPAPTTQGGMPIMQALKERKSVRAYADKGLPLQVLSDLLWAANGINRPGTDFHTAPSTRHTNAIELYVVLPLGTYLYEPKTHQLQQVLEGDVREFTGMQGFVATAPVNLVYVVDTSKQSSIDESRRMFYASADCSFIGQNVYLYCASVGLGTVFRGMVNTDKMGQILKLPVFKKVVFAQSVGYPAEPQQ